MVHVLQTTHDASNALSTALINAELLRKSTEARNRGEHMPIDERETAEELTRQLVRLRSLVEETREVGHAGGDHIDAPRIVAPLPVISDVLRELRVRYPDVQFGSSGPESSIGVIVSGGVESLRRILENLVLNACQGDGERGARRIEVSLEEAPTVGSIAICVRDDGPGFGAEQLARPITGAVSLTIVLVAFFLIEGIASIMFALDHRREMSRGRWGWMLASGVFDLGLGGFIVMGLPAVPPGALGLLVGILPALYFKHLQVVVALTAILSDGLFIALLLDVS